MRTNGISGEKSAPVLATKLFIPPLQPRDRVVPRPRLIQRLDEGLRLGRKMTLVSAPAGFGKTTLISEWVNRLDRPAAWLSLDEEDSDPARFLSYLVAALQTIDEEIGQVTQSLLAAPQPPPRESLLTTLVNDIAGTRDPFALVLDDYHAVQRGWIQEAIDFLVAHQPPQLHLILVTRQDPPLPLPRLRVRDEVTEVRADELRFTTEEAVTFLNQALGLTLDEATIGALEDRTEGWIAGLQLAAMSMQGRSAEQAADFVEAFSGSHRHVIDYLAQEVLAQQPDDIRAFLCQTAILDRLTAPLCNAVTGRDDAGALLKQLEDANLFLIPLDDQREWYRYHQLFADFLRTELDSETQATLHRRAASWFATHALLPEAIRHALASGELNEAARLIILGAEGAFRSGALMTLRGWLDALPDQLVRSKVELATYKGFLLFLTDRWAEAAAYKMAAERCLSPEASPLSRGRLQSLGAHLALCDNDVSTASQLSKRALKHLGEGDVVFRSLTLNVLGQALEMQGDVATAADAYRQGALTGRRAGNQLGAVVATVNLIFALNEMGQRREAVTVCRQVAQEDKPVSKPVSPETDGIYVAWSMLSYEANELELAHEQAWRALKRCEQLSIMDGVLRALYNLALVDLARGEWEAMRKHCQEGRELAGRMNLQQLQGAWFSALEAQANLGQGNLAAAARWAEAAELTPADAPHHWFESVYFTYVRWLLSQERLDDAQTLLATIERSAEQGGRYRKLVTVYLQQGLVWNALGQRQRAVERIERALRYAAPEGYRRAFLDEGSSMADLLSRARHVAPPFVDSVLEVFEQERSEVEGEGAVPAPPVPRATGKALLEPLTERELEILRLIAAGRSNPEIAEQLYLSTNTVKWHAKNLYGKLNVGNRVEAAARAHELGLL